MSVPPVSRGHVLVTGVLPEPVTEVSRDPEADSSIGLRRNRTPGEDSTVSRTLLEPFWPGRRAHAFDEFCR
jgi:hypothetical protein